MLVIQDVVSKILVTEQEIAEINKRLGAEITKNYAGKNLIMVSVLKGSSIFMSDLIRNVDLPCVIDFMEVSSYSGMTGGNGNVKILKDLSVDIKNCDVLIVEDILESGYTIDCVIRMLNSRNPGSIRICTFIDKPQRRKIDIKADYVGVETGSEFVIGYGMDYYEKYRNLPFIGLMNPKYI